MMSWLVIIFLLLATSGGLAQERKASSLEEHGRTLAERMCSACMRSEGSARVRTLARRRSARSIAAWSLIRSQSGCAKA